jgi:hypothetical protein
MDWVVTREPDDKLAETRVSIGSLPDEQGAYLVFRGDPDKVVDILEQALDTAKGRLPQGAYKDTRGRPQG